MIDNTYSNAFKEVYDILKNTEEELVKKIPENFIIFLKKNMNKDYQTNIQPDLQIDKQNILTKTESILALIYRSYWITDDEKLEFANTYNQEILSKEVKTKNIDDIFNQRKNINKVTIDNNLMVIKEENFFIKLFYKLLNIFKK